MKSFSVAKRLAVLFTVAASLTITTTFVSLVSAFGSEQASEVAEPQPVDDSMHHFMEYVMEPNYLRLKASMATSPADKKAWKAVKGDALTLAESANLLLLRAPKEDADNWRKQSVAVRKHGGDLYRAARKSDYAAAHKAYMLMLKNCNSCHTQFADGKHQLKP